MTTNTIETETTPVTTRPHAPSQKADFHLTEVRKLNYRHKTCTYGVVVVDGKTQFVVFPRHLRRELIEPATNQGAQKSGILGREVIKARGIGHRFSGIQAEGGTCLGIFVDKDLEKYLTGMLEGQTNHKFRDFLRELLVDLRTAVYLHAGGGGDWLSSVTTSAPSASATVLPRRRRVTVKAAPLSSHEAVSEPGASVGEGVSQDKPPVSAPADVCDGPSPCADSTSTKTVEVEGASPIPTFVQGKPRLHLRVLRRGKMKFHDFFGDGIQLADAEDGERYVPIPELSMHLAKAQANFGRYLRKENEPFVALVPFYDTEGSLREQLAINIKRLPYLLLELHMSQRLDKVMDDRIYGKVLADFPRALADFTYEGNASNPAFTQEERDQTRAVQDAETKGKEPLANLAQAPQMAALVGVFAKMQLSQEAMLTEIRLMREENRLALASRINTQTHHVLERTPAQGHDSCQGFAKKKELPMEAAREILIALGLVGDLDYGYENPLATGSNGRMGKVNWRLRVASVEQVTEMPFTRYRKEYKRLIDLGEKKSAANRIALQSTLRSITEKVGKGTWKKLTRELSPEERSNS